MTHVEESGRGRERGRERERERERERRGGKREGERKNERDLDIQRKVVEETWNVILIEVEQYSQRVAAIHHIESYNHIESGSA